MALDQVELKLPEAEFAGGGELRFGKADLQSLAAQGTGRSDAAQVADVLEAWEIGEGHDASGRVVKLGMSGTATAESRTSNGSLGSSTRLAARAFWNGTSGRRTWAVVAWPVTSQSLSTKL